MDFDHSSSKTAPTHSSQALPSTTKTQRGITTNYLLELGLNFTLNGIWPNERIFIGEIRKELSVGFLIDISDVNIENVLQDTLSNKTRVASRIHSATVEKRANLISKIGDLLIEDSEIRKQDLLKTLNTSSIKVAKFCTIDGSQAVERSQSCPSDPILSSSSASSSTVLWIVGIVIGIIALVFIGIVIREIFIRTRGPEIPQAKTKRPRV